MKSRVLSVCSLMAIVLFAALSPSPASAQFGSTSTPTPAPKAGGGSTFTMVDQTIDATNGVVASCPTGWPSLKAGASMDQFVQFLQAAGVYSVATPAIWQTNAGTTVYICRPPKPAAGSHLVIVVQIMSSTTWANSNGQSSFDATLSYFGFTQFSVNGGTNWWAYYHLTDASGNQIPDLNFLQCVTPYTHIEADIHVTILANDRGAQDFAPEAIVSCVSVRASGNDLDLVAAKVIGDALTVPISLAPSSPAAPTAAAPATTPTPEGTVVRPGGIGGATIAAPAATQPAASGSVSS